MDIQFETNHSLIVLILFGIRMSVIGASSCHIVIRGFLLSNLLVDGAQTGANRVWRGGGGGGHHAALGAHQLSYNEC